MFRLICFLCIGRKEEEKNSNHKLSLTTFVPFNPCKKPSKLYF